MNRELSQPSVILSYGVAVFSVAVSHIILSWMQIYFGNASHVSLFLCAVMFSAWFGGVGPGVLAIIVSILAFAYILPPAHSFAFEITQLPRLLLYTLSALFIVSLIGKQKHSEKLLKRSEEAIRRSAAQLQLVVNTIPSLVWTAQPDGSLDFINQVHQEFTGLSLDEVGDWRWTAVIHPEDSARFVGLWRAALATGEPLEAEARLRRVHGDYRWLLIRAVPLRDESGKIVKWYGTKTDITERKEAEEKLSAREEDLKTIFAILPTGISILDKEGKIIEMNLALQTILEMSAQGLLNSDYVRRKYLRADGTPMPGEQFPSSRAIKEQRPILDTEIGVVKEDGTTTWTVVSAAPLPGSRSVVVTADITKRKQGEEELRKFFRATEQSPDNVFITNKAGIIEYVNSAFVELTGYDRENAIGSAPRIVKSGAHDQEFYKNLWGTINRGEAFRSVLTNRKKNGELYFEEKTISPLTDQQGNITHFVSTGRDITDRIQAERATIASEKKYHDLVDATTVGVFQAALDGKLIFANSGFVQMAGYTSIDELGSSTLQSLYRNRSDHTRLVELLEVDGKATEFEAEFLTQVGSVKTIIMSATLDDNLISGVCIDITGRKKIEVTLHATEGRLRRLSHRLLEIQENERRQIARELHDEIGQILTATKIDLEVLRRSQLPEELIHRLIDDITMVDACLSEVRNLSLELRPSILDDLGLIAAMRWQLERFQQRVGFAGSLNAENISERFDPDLETACFRIAQEALTNIAKHGKAHHVEIEMKRHPAELAMTIRDDGAGFDVGRAMVEATKSKSFGILGMQERVSLLGGSLEFKSAVGKGTTISARLPIGAANGGKRTS